MRAETMPLPPSVTRGRAPMVPAPKVPADAAGAVPAPDVPEGMIEVSIDLMANASAGPNSHDARTNLDWCVAEAARINAQPGRIARVLMRGKRCVLIADGKRSEP